MNNRVIHYLVPILLALVILPGPSTAMPYSNLYVVGDSLSDARNLFLATSNNQIPPFPQLPQDPPYFQGRFSDGPGFSEHLWRRLDLPGNIQPSLLGGTNYAVGGARSRYHTFDQVINPQFDPLSDASLFAQFSLLGQRDALLGSLGNTLDSSALYSVWIGSNDVADAFRLALNGASPAYIDALLQQTANDLLSVIDDMTGAGARDFLVPNVPNFGLVPEVKNAPNEVKRIATNLASSFNTLVDAKLGSVDANIIRLDVFGFLTDLVNDPTVFGLPADTNVQDACFSGFVGVPGVVCDKPEAYVFWDSIHPTATTHQLLGQVAAAAVIPEPPVILLAFVGLASIGFSLRKTALKQTGGLQQVHTEISDAK